MTKLYLASKSPRRRLLLDKLVADFEVCVIDIEESPHINESVSDYVLRIAMDKAESAKKYLSKHVPVLSADTEVVRDGRILGKPGSHDVAVDMLMSLSGRCHEVYTAIVLITDKPRHFINKNRVCFRNINRSEVEQYCLSQQPLDKAGAYGIQEDAAGFIDKLEGSYSGVMGLPLADTRRLLSQAGII